MPNDWPGDTWRPSLGEQSTGHLALSLQEAFCIPDLSPPQHGGSGTCTTRWAFPHILGQAGTKSA